MSSTILANCAAPISFFQISCRKAQAGNGGGSAPRRDHRYSRQYGLQGQRIHEEEFQVQTEDYQVSFCNTLDFRHPIH